MGKNSGSRTHSGSPFSVDFSLIFIFLLRSASKKVYRAHSGARLGRTPRKGVRGVHSKRSHGPQAEKLVVKRKLGGDPRVYHEKYTRGSIIPCARPESTPVISARVCGSKDGGADRSVFAGRHLPLQEENQFHTQFPSPPQACVSAVGQR